MPANKAFSADLSHVIAQRLYEEYAASLALAGCSWQRAIIFKLEISMEQTKKRIAKIFLPHMDPRLKAEGQGGRGWATQKAFRRMLTSVGRGLTSIN